MNFLHHLKSKQDVDEAIRNTEERVLVLRFGKENEIGCMQTDDIMSRTETLLSEMATICTVNISDVPEYVDYFDITHIPATVFFFNGQHIKVNSGMPDHTKFIGPFQTKQDFIDLVEVVFRGAIRGKYLVNSPIDRRRLAHYEMLYKDY
ncbi:thioredoxin-like protein 4B [Argiope bruennichi]|uniref:Thioredoxin-like protein n=1 Tax=Argiope bruennichi TaxID=94029 RepID=A0A8T0EP34_ARGBR|nr:thioredoxin-like protein 4B [Argiope bruennichi]KAF8777663.1 Thioredoxin-like protein 4B like protein [Argiope bruennichi]